MRSRSLVTKTVFRDSYYEKGIIPNVHCGSAPLRNRSRNRRNRNSSLDSLTDQAPTVANLAAQTEASVQNMQGVVDSINSNRLPPRPRTQSLG